MRLITERVGCNEFAQEPLVIAEWSPSALYSWLLRFTTFAAGWNFYYGSLVIELQRLLEPGYLRYSFCI